MLLPPVLDAIAAEMQDAQDHARQIRPFSDRHPGFDLADAYGVAGRIHRERLRRGAVPVGRKIGFTNPAMWRLYGVQQPVWGHVYDYSLRDAPGCANISLSEFAEPKIEPEIILHFCRTPPPRAHAEVLIGCIDWIAHGFEIVQSHFPGWNFTAADTVADQALHGILLIGERRRVGGPDIARQLESFSLELHCDGSLRETGTGANVLGSPLKALEHLAGVLASQSPELALHAGELVTTGTITAAFAVTAGERWHSTIRGIDLPGLDVLFTP